MKPRTKCSPEEFVRIWQTAKNMDEVIKRSGMPRTTCGSKAGLYRKKGVMLKKFSDGHQPPDWDKLQKIAAELAQAPDKAKVFPRPPSGPLVISKLTGKPKRKYTKRAASWAVKTAAKIAPNQYSVPTPAPKKLELAPVGGNTP